MFDKKLNLAKVYCDGKIIEDSFSGRRKRSNRDLSQESVVEVLLGAKVSSSMAQFKLDDFIFKDDIVNFVTLYNSNGFIKTTSSSYNSDKGYLRKILFHEAVAPLSTIPLYPASSTASLPNGAKKTEDFISLNGINQYIVVSQPWEENCIFYPNCEFSLSFEFRFDGSTTNDQYFITLGGSSRTEGGLIFGFLPTDDNLPFRRHFKIAFKKDRVEKSIWFDVEKDTWYNLFISVESPSTLKVYLNDQLLAKNEKTKSIDTVTQANNLVIGKHSSETSSFAKISLKSFNFWKRAVDHPWSMIKFNYDSLYPINNISLFYII